MQGGERKQISYRRRELGIGMGRFDRLKILRPSEFLQSCAFSCGSDLDSQRNRLVGSGESVKG